MEKDSVEFQRPEYVEANRWRWPLVRDLCIGSERVKARGTRYLPKPNAHDTSKQNDERYLAYVQRAVYYNATGGTRGGLIGTVYRVDPSLEVPSLLDYVKTDIDGAGNSIYQQSQAVVGDLLETGRAFLLADYPNVQGATSVADQQAGRIRSTVSMYAAESVINWRTETIGAEHVLTLVVLSEQKEMQGEFALELEQQYRVLRLVEGAYIQEVWTQVKADNGTVSFQADPDQTFTPKRSNGQPWDRIPGTFVGAQNNDSTIDEAPLYDIAEVNLGHYRNSADYEDAAFLCGQPQPWMSGLDEGWRDHMEKSGIYLGSRAPWLLPVNGACGVWQAQPNTLAKEAMDSKEAQMVALGARLIKQGSATKTATQAANENAEQHSVLSLIAANVSEAYTTMLGYLGEFMGAAGTVEFKLSQDFVEATLDAQMLQALVGAWQGGAITQSDLLRQLRKYDLIDPEKTDEQVMDELETASAGLSLDDNNGDLPATR